MQYTEKLDWILDKIGHRLGNDDLYQQNIDFVHSLGLKCDCVGWCKLELADPRTPKIFEKISAFCRENGWTARAYYNRSYVDVESDWYELVPAKFKDSTDAGFLDAPSEDGDSVHICTLRTFHELTPAPKSYGPYSVLVPERFRNACLRCGIDDLDFCWTKDVGKYEGEQYFHIYGKRPLPKLATDYQLDKLDPERIRAAGGWLPALTGVIHEFQQINLPNCYLRSDLPEGGIVQAQVVRKYQYLAVPEDFQNGESPLSFPTKEVTSIERNHILIHKDTAEMLLREKALPASALRPAPVVDELPGGYVWEDCVHPDRPTPAFRYEMLAAYETLKTTPRPVRTVTEKEALKVLRAAKKERKEGFQKALPRARWPELSETAHAPMAAYYSVSNGGFLSDEYELLSYDRSVAETAEFHRALDAEELLTKKPEGIVIAKCPDGDAVLLYSNSTVIRFSHEAPEILDQWSCLPQFIADAVNDG